MIAADPDTGIIVPASLAAIGAVIAGISAVVKAWFENRDARRKTERQLELAKSRTQFVGDWIRVSKELGADPKAVKRAIDELNEAYGDAQVAFARTRTRSVFGQFRGLLMLVRRRNRASYVVSGVFLFVATFVWLILCIPEPGDDSFSYFAAIFSAFFTTIVLRVAAEMIVRVFERLSKSEARVITAASLTDNVAAITTSTGHGLEPAQVVVVDATNDVFDGAFAVASVTSDTTFTYSLTAANVPPAVVKGSVYRDTFTDQVRALAMLQGGRSIGAYVASALFLISLLVMAQWSLTGAMSDLRADDNPRCYLDGEYFGSYFGDVDPYYVPPYDDSPLDGNDQDIDVDSYKQTFFPDATNDFEYVAATKTDGSSDGGFWRLQADDGNVYAIDEYTGLYYFDGSSDLFRLGRDERFTDIGDPCDPQTLEVRTTTVDPDLTIDELRALPVPLFAYYQPPEYSDLIFVNQAVDNNEGRSGQGPDAQNDVEEVRGYFGRDGRFIPVCGDTYAAIQPCIEETSVVYDSGLYATVLRLWTAGLQIIGFAIASRLLFGLIAWGFDKHANRRSKSKDATDNDPSVPASALPTN